MPNKMNMQQFGASIKAKHPEYKDMDDSAVGKAVIAKYPQYNDMVEAAPTPGIGAQILSGAEDVGKGMLKGAGSTANNIGKMLIPDRLVRALGGTPPTQPPPMLQTHGTAQGIGKGIEQAGEFMLPGLGEEGAGARLAELAPRLGRAAAPIARAGVQTLGSAAVNKAQGGSATTGALMGAGGAAVGEGMRAAAPLLAESALGVRGADKIRGRTVGQAIMDETTGFRPATVLKSAQERLGQLNTQNENLVRAAGQRPISPVRGLLEAPQYDVPLQSSPDVAGTPSEPITLHQPDRPARLGLPSPTGQVPMSSHAGIFPEQLPSATSSVPLRSFEGPAQGMGQGEYVGQVSGNRGGLGEPQGVLRTRNPAISGNVPEPAATPIPYNPVSLAPARQVASEAMGKAAAQNTPGPYHAFKNLGDVVNKRFMTGEPIPEQVSPMEGLQLKRGIGNFMPEGSWNPESVSRIAPVRDAMYGSMMGELERAVPETGPINQRISSLLPVTRRAEMMARAPGVLENTMNRFRTPNGALTGMFAGGAAGAATGGLPGAMMGAGAGALLPSAISSPTTQMIMARGLYNGVPKLVPAATGTALQLDRENQ